MRRQFHPITPSTFGASTRAFATAKRLITRFEDLPPDYTDEEGLDFRATQLSQAETQKIFGPGIDAPLANRALRVWHGRRVAGTLDVVPDIPGPRKFQQRVDEIALGWLRKNVKVNEGRSKRRREKALEQEEDQKLLEESERLGIYQPNTGSSGNVYGKSGLDYLRERNKEYEAKLEAEQRQKAAQAEEIRRNTGSLEVGKANSPKAYLQRTGPSPKLQEYIKRGTIGGDEPPEMTAWQRLFPSTIFLGFVIGFCALLAIVYTPPRQADRMWPDIPPSAATLIGVFLINASIFTMWRIPPLYRFMNTFFIHTPGMPKVFSLFGNTWSHNNFKHLLTNWVLLWFMGTSLHDDVGRGTFLAILIASGTIGCYASFVSSVMQKRFYTSSLGISGGLYGVLGAYFWFHRDDRFTLWGRSESGFGIPGWVFLIFWTFGDLGVLFFPAKILGGIDHMSHLGGVVTGIASAQILRNYVEQRKRGRVGDKQMKVEKAGDDSS